MQDTELVIGFLEMAGDEGVLVAVEDAQLNLELDLGVEIVGVDGYFEGARHPIYYYILYIYYTRKTCDIHCSTCCS